MTFGAGVLVGILLNRAQLRVIIDSTTDPTGLGFAWTFILAVVFASVAIALAEAWQESHREDIDRRSWGIRHFLDHWQARARQDKREG